MSVCKKKMSRQDALHLDAGDVSHAWLVWSGAAEAALVEAYRFSGGPFLVGVWFLAEGALCFGSSNLVVIRFGRREAMLLML